MSGLNALELPPAAGPVPAPQPLRRIALLLVGHTGRVGGALVRLIAAQRARLAAEARLELHLACTVNRSNAVWHPAESPWREEHLARSAGDWPQLLRRFRALPGPKLLVDCTAAAEVAAQYLEALQAGIAVVTANKIANSGPASHYAALRQTAAQERVAYRYETTAGAALPLIAPLADLKANGDEVRRLEAVLSGTLSFLFQRLNQGLSFSAAVREARDQGYTEPHPAEDLKAQDSARKLVILLREAGIACEPEDIAVHGLSPPELESEPDPELYIRGLARHDAAWAEHIAACRSQGLRLTCLAEYDGRRARIGLTQLPAADPFAQLAGGENLLRVWTRRYQPVPLSIAGPGAGTEVTAAGLFTDILKAATLSQRL